MSNGAISGSVRRWGSWLALAVFLIAIGGILARAIIVLSRPVSGTEEDWAQAFVVIVIVLIVAISLSAGTLALINGPTVRLVRSLMRDNPGAWVYVAEFSVIDNRGARNQSLDGGQSGASLGVVMFDRHTAICWRRTAGGLKQTVSLQPPGITHRYLLVDGPLARYPGLEIANNERTVRAILFDDVRWWGYRRLRESAIVDVLSQLRSKEHPAQSA